MLLTVKVHFRLFSGLKKSDLVAIVQCNNCRRRIDMYCPEMVQEAKAAF